MDEEDRRNILDENWELGEVIYILYNQDTYEDDLKDNDDESRRSGNNYEDIEQQSTVDY